MAKAGDAMSENMETWKREVEVDNSKQSSVVEHEEQICGENGGLCEV